MEVSFDGMRRNATRSMNNLQSDIEDLLEEIDDEIYGEHRESLKKSLIKSFNESAMFVDSFNCLMSECENFTHLDIEIKIFEEEK